MTQTYPIKCQIRAAESGVTRVDVFDDIGEGGWFSEGLTAKAFSAQMAQVKGALEVHVNSGGGDVFDGIAIGNAIRAHKGPVTTVVDGLAASIASVIAQAGQDRVVQPGSMLMIHDAFGMTVGNAAEMRQMADTLDKVSDNIAELYASRSGAGSAASWRDEMRGEKWYTADEAVAAGLADRVGDGSAELPAGLDLAAFSAVPGRIAARLRSMPQAKADPVRPQAAVADEHGHPGRECWDPDGDGDCDLTPEADTDHDYWAPDGTQLKSVPGKPLPDGAQGMGEADFRALMFSVLADAAQGVDSSPWDASRAWHNGAEADDPAAFYAGICAGRKDGDKSTQDAWALPYKYTPSSPPNADGVKAALSRLPQTEGLTNEAEAKKTLQAAMKRINPDYEPGDHANPDLSGITPEQIRAALKGATE